MSNIPPSRDRMLSATGVVLNGAKRYFYASGTTTPINTYTTRALSVANANPVVADSGGLFGPIWITPGTNYREVLKDSSDNTIYDVDDQYPLTMDNATLSTQVYETAENPNHYGAAGTGSADESTDVQQAIDAAVANSREGVVDLMGRTYRCDSAITLYSGLTLRNGTLDFSNCTADDYIKAQGSFGSPVSLASNATANAAGVTLTSGTGFATNDWVLLDDSGGALNGEMARVRDVSGAVVQFFSTINDPYTTANSARVREITPVTDLRMRDLVIIANPAASGSGRVIFLDRVIGAVVENVRFRGHKGACIEIRTSADIRIDKCQFQQTVPGGTYDIGVNVCDSARDVAITACTFSGPGAGGVVTGVNTSGGVGGVTRNVVVRDSKFEDTFMTAGAFSEYMTTDGCAFSGGDALAISMYLYGYAATVTNCDFHAGLTGTTAVSVAFTDNRSTAANNRRANISNNRFIGKDIAGTSTRAIDRIVIANNTFQDSGDINLAFSGAAVSVKNIAVSGNVLGTGKITLSAAGGTDNMTHVTVSGNACSGVALSGNSTNQAFYCTVTGNSIATTSGASISLEYVSMSTVTGNTSIGSSTFTSGISVVNYSDGAANIAITGNHIRTGLASANYGIVVQDTDAVTISGNVCSGAFSEGIFVNAETVPVRNVAVCGNSVDGIQSGDTYSGIRIEGDAAANAVYRPVVTGNSVMSSGRAVRLDGDIEGGVVTGNSLEAGAAVNSVVYLNGRAAGTMNNVVVSGNALREAVYGLEVANGAETIHDGNSFYSNSTGILSGAVSTAGDSA